MYEEEDGVNAHSAGQPGLAEGQGEEGGYYRRRTKGGAVNAAVMADNG